MGERPPTIVLVHGAFAESASWSPVVEQLQSRGLEVIAAANPLRGLAGDAAHVRDVTTAIGRPTVLVGHAYGGSVITEAAANNDAVVGLVYVAGFAPDTGESVVRLSMMFPGSELDEVLVARAVSTGGRELTVRPDAYQRRLAADVSESRAALMAVTQRPVTEAALSDGLPAEDPSWRRVPSWFVFGDQDLVIPVVLHRFMAERADAEVSRELAGSSHAIGVSEPEAVAATILEAVTWR